MEDVLKVLNKIETSLIFLWKYAPGDKILKSDAASIGRVIKQK